MGAKVSSRQGLSKETLEFLVRNTNFSQDMIKVIPSSTSKLINNLITTLAAILTILQEWYTGFRHDCPSGELTPDKFIAMYSQVVRPHVFLTIALITHNWL